MRGCDDDDRIAVEKCCAAAEPGVVGVEQRAHPRQRVRGNPRSSYRSEQALSTSQPAVRVVGQVGGTRGDVAGRAGQHGVDDLYWDDRKGRREKKLVSSASRSYESYRSYRSSRVSGIEIGN